MTLRGSLGVVVLVSAAACSAPTSPARIDAGTPGATGAGAGIAISATGGGHYLLQGSLDTQFAFSAAGGPGRAVGRFHQSLTFGGFPVEFHGEVTCVSVDAANHRAWIGGVITKNLSEHPSFQAARHQPGRDIWFRVLDSGEGGAAAPDRTTFLGFEGDAGFATSAAYCAGQPWPDDNERTWPVTAGNIQVRP